MKASPAAVEHFQRQRGRPATASLPGTTRGTTATAATAAAAAAATTTQPQQQQQQEADDPLPDYQDEPGAFAESAPPTPAPSRPKRDRRAPTIQGIAVCLLRDQEQPLPRTAFKSSFQQDQVGFQTQLSHRHISTNMRMYDRFELVLNDLCSVYRTVLHTKLQALSGASNDYSLVDILGKGHHVFSMGTVAYMASCIAVEAQKADFQNCTKEIPVRVGNKTRFTDPFTYILTDFPTVLPCSDLTPVRWFIAGKWSPPFTARGALAGG